MNIKGIGSIFRSIFGPTLLDGDAPPCVEISGSDLCYSDVLCSSLEHGQRCQVGSWYLTPERHAIEYVFTTLIVGLILYFLWPILPHPSYDSTSTTLSQPKSLKIHTFGSTIIVLIYKFIGFQTKILCMAMPCNTLWLLFSLMCWDRLMNDRIRYALIQTSFSYMGLVFLALAVPDLSTFNILFEVEWFFLHHYMLFIIPFYYLLTGKVSVLSLQVDSQSLSSSVSFFIRYWLFTCTIFACYYVTIITPISLLSGLNLNYMLNPPPLPVDWVQGPNYRLISCVLVFTVFALFRGIFMVLEILLRSLFIPIAKRKAT